VFYAWTPGSVRLPVAVTIAVEDGTLECRTDERALEIAALSTVSVPLVEGDRLHASSEFTGGFAAYLKHYPLPQPRIVHNLYTLSPVP